MQQERPANAQQTQPPEYAQHDPKTLNLPSVPTHTLPSLRSLDLPDVHASRASIELSPKAASAQWLPPPLHSATFPRVPDGDVGSPMEVDRCSVVSGDDRRREMSVLSVDDPDVRLAAEALSGLGNPDFARSPTSRSVTLSARSPTAEPEPLLNLLTSMHPWLGGGINGSISAYNTTKTYSPRFVKYGAELIERNIGSPVVNTVSSVGRRTGVEQNLRRYLGEVHRRPSDLEQGDEGGRKRMRVMSPGDTDAMDVEDGGDRVRTRGGSLSSYAESLPEYDDHRSPKYEETAIVTIDPVTGKETSQQESSTAQGRSVNWSTQLIMTTSGLGIALSDASLKSLRMCLGLLRGATRHIDNVMHALKQVLEEYEQALRNNRQHGSENDTTMTHGADSSRDEQVRLIADRMKNLSTDIWLTLQKVVQSVSRYTGGALPQNASQVVRTQLLSVPQRWQLASRTTATDTEQQSGGEEVRGANRMLAFAKEGLDMMGQITTVVDGTVQSADAWLARIGRGPRQEGSGEGRVEEKGAYGPVAVSMNEKR